MLMIIQNKSIAIMQARALLVHQKSSYGGGRDMECSFYFLLFAGVIRDFAFFIRRRLRRARSMLRPQGTYGGER